MKTRKYILIATGFIVLALDCCSSKESKTKFPEDFFLEDSTKTVLAKVPYFISSKSQDWNLEFIGSWEDFDSTSARFSKIENDTLKNLVIGLDKFNNAVSVLHYQKEFPIGSAKYQVTFGRLDTLYYYYTKKGSDLKVFVNGGYFYKGYHLEFDSNERKYYRLHKDSLDNIRGNELPKLPSLSSAELLEYKKRFEQ